MSMVEEIGVTLLGLVLKLYPEIAALLKGAPEGALPPHVAEAIEKAMPLPGASALALKTIQGMT
jgi:hypothetical protein